MSAEFNSHPLDTEGFWFVDRRERDGKVLRLIKSHVAYDHRWPWWRRWWADLRGRP